MQVFLEYDGRKKKGVRYRRRGSKGRRCEGIRFEPENLFRGCKVFNLFAYNVDSSVVTRVQLGVPMVFSLFVSKNVSGLI
jgi:hypothetical protein